MDQAVCLNKLNNFSLAISTIEFNKEGSFFAYGNAAGIVSVVEIGLAVSQQSLILSCRRNLIAPKPDMLVQNHTNHLSVMKPNLMF